MLSQFASIDTFILDIDGVLTDGTLYLMADGEMVRRMHIKDGYAIQLAVKQGYNILIISGGISVPVQLRLRKLGVENIYLGVHDKKTTMLKLLEKLNLNPERTIFMGDDMPDIEAMQASGLPCCPADACPEVQAVSKYISPLAGGAGCVRDVIEKVMKVQGKWQTIEGVTSR